MTSNADSSHTTMTVRGHPGSIKIQRSQADSANRNTMGGRTIQTPLSLTSYGIYICVFGPTVLRHLM